MMRSARLLRLAAALAALVVATPLGAQDVTIRDLTIPEGGGPIRLVGYGLVTGLSGTGDRVTGMVGSRHTVQSIVNLLRNFQVQVPANLLRTRNVAAVLVTAEVSPYLRPGGRFDVQVSSIGDAQSLRGGILWMTPLVSDVGGDPLAAAQGAMMITETGTATRVSNRGVTAGRVPAGGVIEGELPRPQQRRTSRLLLKEPDAAMALRIAAAIDSVTGRKATAEVEDPGSILLKPQGGADGLPALFEQINDLRIRRAASNRLLVDARSGTVVAGADLIVGDGIVSAEGITLVIGGGGADALPTGTTVQHIAEALRSAQATPQQTAAVFIALRDAGAIHAEVVIR